MTFQSQLTFDINKEFSDTSTVRICEIDKIKNASIFDVLKNILKVQNSRQTWSTLVKNNAKFECTKMHVFPGIGQRATPVADAGQMLHIIFLVPGERASKYRICGLKALLLLLNPTDELMEELHQRQKEIKYNPPKNNFLVPTENRPTLRNLQETFMYIRVRLPDESLSNISISKQKAMTLDIIKFGITYSLYDRNTSYNRDECDNGFMLFSYAFEKRCEGELIENMLKNQFSHLTVHNSREYLNTSQLAEALNCKTYVPDNYEQYINVAAKLLTRIVYFAQVIWPDRYNNNARIYHIVTEQSRSVQQNLNRNGQLVLAPMKIMFDHQHYDVEPMQDDIVLQLKTEKKEHLFTKKRLATEILEHSATRRQLEIIQNTKDNEHTEDLREQKSKNLIIIARDIITGDETTFPTSTAAAESINYSPTALIRTFLNKARQAKGKHFRSLGEPYWIPPKELHIDFNRIDTSTLGYIKATPVNDEVNRRPIIFESIKAGADYFKIDRHTITKYKNLQIPYDGYLWTLMNMQEWGAWQNGPSNITAVASNLNTTGVKPRCKGHVIGYNVDTAEETLFETRDQAAAKYKITIRSLKHAIDKPRLIYRCHFRSSDAKRVWIPPDNYSFDDEKGATRGRGFYVATHVSNNKVYYYETKSLASRETGQSVSMIENHFMKKSISQGISWTILEFSDPILDTFWKPTTHSKA